MNEIKMTEDGISFLEDESKTWLKLQVIELDNLMLTIFFCVLFFSSDI